VWLKVRQLRIFLFDMGNPLIVTGGKLLQDPDELSRQIVNIPDCGFRIHPGSFGSSFCLEFFGTEAATHMFTILP
jgi:hypothetical protein